MNIIQRLTLLDGPRFDPRRVSGLVTGWRGRDPRNGGVGLADGDGITILENWVDPRPAFFDPFTRGDSALTLGNGWADPLQGTFGIASNRAYSVTDANGDLVLRETGLSDFVLSCIVNGDLDVAADSRVPQVQFRALDANNKLGADLVGGAARLLKTDGGVTSVLTTWATATADSTDYVLEVVCNGNSVSIKKNGTALTPAYTLAGGDTKYAAYTQAGIRLGKTGSPAVAARWDNWICAKLTDAIQTTAAAKPLYKTAIQNGRAVGRFDGVASTMQVPAITLPTFCTIYAVGKFTNAKPFFVEQRPAHRVRCR